MWKIGMRNKNATVESEIDYEVEMMAEAQEVVKELMQLMKYAKKGEVIVTFFCEEEVEHPVNDREMWIPE